MSIYLEITSIEPKLPKPTYRNEELEQILQQNAANSNLTLDKKNLTDDDMLIIAYFGIPQNTVSTIPPLTTCETHPFTETEYQTTPAKTNKHHHTVSNSGSALFIFLKPISNIILYY